MTHATIPLMMRTVRWRSRKSAACLSTAPDGPIEPCYGEYRSADLALLRAVNPRYRIGESSDLGNDLAIRRAQPNRSIRHHRRQKGVRSGVFWTLGPYRGKSFEPKGIRCDVLGLVGGIRDVMPGLARGNDRHPLICAERVTDHEGDPGRDRLPFPSRVTNFERCCARCSEVMQNRRKDSLEPRMRARIAVGLSHAVHIARCCAGRRADQIGRSGVPSS